MRACFGTRDESWGEIRKLTNLRNPKVIKENRRKNRENRENFEKPRKLGEKENSVGQFWMIMFTLAESTIESKVNPKLYQQNQKLHSKVNHKLHPKENQKLNPKVNPKLHPKLNRK